MNKSLLDSIYGRIRSAVSGSTEHVYFLYLPSADLLDSLTVVYELNNSANENLFDTKESVRFYSLRIKLNAPTANSFDPISIYLKNAIYDLVQRNENVRYVNLLAEEIFFDSELNVFTQYMSFEIQYS